MEKSKKPFKRNELEASQFIYYYSLIFRGEELPKKCIGLFQVPTTILRSVYFFYTRFHIPIAARTTINQKIKNKKNKFNFFSASSTKAGIQCITDYNSHDSNLYFHKKTHQYYKAKCQKTTHILQFQSE